MIGMPGTPDAVIIAGPRPQEFLGGEIRERMRLTIDDVPASLNLLRHYFDLGRDIDAARTHWERQELAFVSLNGPYLCQFLGEQGISTKLIRLFIPGDPELEAALASGPKAVVISTTFLPLAEQIDKIAAYVKERAPDSLVVAGGTQVWKSYQHLELVEKGQIEDDVLEAVAEHNYFIDPSRPSPVDAFVVNVRGEENLASLLRCVKDGWDWRELPNVAYYDDGRWKINPVENEGYREVRVDWSQVIDDVPVWVPVQAGQGCGFRCTFCDFYGLQPKVNIRDNMSLIEEIATIPEVNGYRRLYFTDDNLFTSKKRAREFCRELIAAKHLNIKWRGMIRVAIVDEEIAGLMAESGCVEVLLGIESGDRKVLTNMKKLSTPEQILGGLAVLNHHGINTKSTFIVGFPGETEQTVSNTIDVLNAYPCDGDGVHRYTVFTFGVLPLSTIARPKMRERFDLRGYGFKWSHNTMDSDIAQREMVRMIEALKPELSPSYVMEVSDLDGIERRELKRIYMLRNRLAMARRDGESPAVEARLWDELEAVFKRCPAPAAVGV